MTDAPFCGREAELAALLAEWDAICAGAGPRAVAVLGEPGLGKTRLVQAFFGAISARAGAGYWPPVLGRLGNNLQVNPDAAPGRTGAPPFLWWGLRLVDPLVPNSVGAGVLASGVENHLKPQIAHLHHLERRKERRGEALSIGKGVVLDLAIDLIPFGGLAKTLGEAGADLHRLYREDRADGASAGDGLIGATLDDLEMALAPGGDAPRPAVILIDDAQHSTHDPGVTAFVEALAARAVAGNWPLLLIVTHWEREWDAPVPGSVAAVLSAPSAPRSREIRLKPLPDLTPLLEAGLPGLTPAQRAALLTRADGNPRFLGEMILFAAASRGLFVGGDVTGALTDNGLTRLLARSTNLHDLTATRLRESPPDVQDAVCLATLQGVEFLDTVLGGTATRLYRDAGAVTAAVGTAERPHAYVRAVDPGVAAFAQRIYFEVASEHLENCFDPDEARGALQDGFREIATSPRFNDLGPVELRRFLALGAALFESAGDIADRRIAATCLHRLALQAEADGDLHAWRGLIRRLDAMIEAAGDDLLDADLDWLRAIYVAADGPDAREVEARAVGRMCRLTAGALEDDENDWTIWMHIRSLALRAEHCLNWGDTEGAIEAALAARQILDQWPVAERTPQELRAWLEVYGVIARTMSVLGMPEKAIEFHEAQLLVLARIRDLDPADDEVGWYETFVERRLGSLAWQTGDSAGAVRHLEAAVARYRGFAADGRHSVELPGALSNLAMVVLPDEPDRGRALLEEAVGLSRDLVARADDAQNRRILAWVLFDLAQLKAADPGAAYPLAAEAGALLDRDGDDPHTPVVRAAMVEGFAAAIAERLGRSDDALPHALRAVELARRGVGADASPKARRVLLAAVLQLARIEQAQGEFGHSALRLAEAEGMIADPEFVGVPGFADLAASARDLSAAQPRLH